MVKSRMLIPNSVAITSKTSNLPLVRRHAASDDNSTEKRYG